ncbi:MAG TPA: hypothetical protein VEL05_04315, partial [Candidatus Acidoferrum sp.]|nr:hypothetical protein [Candidatus Acidoferrum sp.]
MIHPRGALAIAIAAHVGLSAPACGGGEGDGTGDSDGNGDGGDAGDGGIEPPAPVCREAGGAARAAAPELAGALSDGGAEAWLASPVVV